ncbi:MAG: cell division protein FtsA [Anaerolineales bacterium]|nr:cell division protein FtsA [Anaerolineales bacterium]
MDDIVVGIDVGTTKVCTLVGRVEAERIRILGVGIEPSEGIRKGVIVDLKAASQVITRSVRKAEQTSGVEITGAVVSLAGAHVSSINSRGVAAVSGDTIDEVDIARALDAARAVAIPHNREIIHIVERGFSVDGQDGIQQPVGMHGYRLEVEAHIITAAQATVENLRQSVGEAGVEVIQFVLNPLASGEVVLRETERQQGVAVCDIGGGTTDLALYVEGHVWHTMVLAVGGNHVTNDIAHGLRLPIPQAEEIKKKHGYALRSGVGAEETFKVQSFGAEGPIEFSRHDMAHIIEARVEEIFALTLQEIKRSGYDGLLPAGMVLTGGTSALPGIRQLAAQVLGMPVRTARPENLVGLVDALQSPAYSTSIGLLHYASALAEEDAPPGHRARNRRPKQDSRLDLSAVKNWLKRLLP